MADFFRSPDDLLGWIKSRPSSEEAASSLVDVIKTYHKDVAVGDEDANDMVEGCRRIFDSKDEREVQDAATILFGVMAKHNLASIKKEASNMKKEAQQVSKQRNGWLRGDRNKWNRVVDGFNEGTPWRDDRDKMFNFTHYYTDAISFDEDPTKVYSGEALWRMYIMDKFSREYMNKEGKWVGGYINDRFYVFPDAGTPANPDAPRDGGNQMGLALGERTRKPRPHQWSTERRLEEARKNDPKDLEVTSSSFGKVTKLSGNIKGSDDKNNDKIYQIFVDDMDMIEAGVDYGKRIELLSNHYDAMITGVAEIDRFARNMIEKHSGIAYSMMKTAVQTIQLGQDVSLQDGSTLRAGDTVVLVGENGGMYNYQIASGEKAGTNFSVTADIAQQINPSQGTPNVQNVGVDKSNIASPQSVAQGAGSSEEPDINDAASEVGLNDTEEPSQPAKV